MLREYRTKDKGGPVTGCCGVGLYTRPNSYNRTGHAV